MYDYKKATTESEFAECGIILRCLIEWFGHEESNKKYAQDIRNFDTNTAILDGIIVGFITIKILTRHTVELHLLGVNEEYHRKGVGTKLLKNLEEKLKKQGYEYLKVETLSDKSTDPFYAKTRAFYYKNGFREFQEITEWRKENPGIILVKKI